MSTLWSIISPRATTNLHTNPSAETGVTGYAVITGGSVAQSSTYARWGGYSVRCTPSANTTDGLYYPLTLTAATSYVFSVYLNAEAIGFTVQAYDQTAGASLASTTATGLGLSSTGWQRVTLAFTTGANTAIRLRVFKTNSASVTPFYTDGWQCEAQSSVTTYCDGDQDDCLWTGTPHGSTSTRAASVRSGGTEATFQSYGVTVGSWSGTGMPPVQNVIKEYTLQDGGRHERTRLKTRVITMNCTIQGSSLNDLHAKRKAFIDLWKSNLVSPEQPVRIKYSGTSTEDMLIDVYYDGGLEATHKGNDALTEQFALRLVAPQPLWLIDGEAAAIPSVQSSVSSAITIAQRSAAGVWDDMGGGAGTGSVTCGAIGKDGSIIVGGNFTIMGGVANYIASWNGSAWSALGTSPNAAVNALAIGPEGRIYTGGSFTSLGGVANTARVGYWSGSAWTSMGAGGAGAVVYGMAVGPDGTVYATGDFTTIGGVAANYIASWNGSAWSAMGTGLNAASGKCLAIGPDGSLYVGGGFTTANGVTVNRIARWTGTTFAALGTGMDGRVDTLAFGPDGTLYAGGIFTTSGGTTTNGLAQWDGVTWTTVGDAYAAASTVEEVAVGPDGTLYIGGTAPDAVVAPTGMTRWNGSAFFPLDTDLGGIGQVASAFLFKDQALYVGYNGGGTGVAAGVTTVTNNGTGNAYPVLRLKGVTNSSIFYQLANYTTGKAIYTNLTILVGEIITLDLRPGAKTFTSDFRGDVSRYILPGSNLADWCLQPGANSVSLYTSASTTTAVLWWDEYRLSLDAGAN